MTSDDPRPADRLLDLVFFAPLGLALVAKDQIPKLAAEARRRFGSQAQVARMVGKMAVTQGSRQGRKAVDRMLTWTAANRGEGPGPAATRSSPGAAAPPAGRPAPVRDLDAEGRRGSYRDREHAGTAGLDAEAAADLPIPGYDSLSASQVVQRLAGLSADELEAVRAYELAGRARKTVLLRIVQLRAAS